MDDYISRAALMAYIEDESRAWGEEYDAHQILGDIEDFPAADVRPVVLCRDCKWYKESELLTPNRFCFRLQDGDGNHIGYNFDDLDFCSYGERREDT